MAIVDLPASRNGHHGKICTILRTNVEAITTPSYVGYEVDLPCTNNQFHELCVYRASNLRKPYDGHEPCSWEDCIWQPKILELC